VHKDDAAVAAAVASDAFVPPADARELKLFITSSGRCGECHVKMWDEWQSSGHAKAATSPVYKASIASAKDPTCERCHAPIATESPKDVVAAEGVTCDVCHTLREPRPARDGGSWRLAVDDMVKYGPRCDLKDHYFHRMGCSPEHKTAEICGTCHWWEPNGLPVFTEYADWKAGPQAAEGLQCQDCHMPKEKAQIAEGSPFRQGVPHHGLLGLANDLRSRALGLEVKVDKAGDALAIGLVVTNNNAGHAVPAGLPEHRIVVRVKVLDAKGSALAGDTRTLGRKLVDMTGAEVPFWRATRVESDTRITVGGKWSDTMHLPAANAASVSVDVVYRGLSDAAAEQLHVTDVEEIPMVRASVKLGGALPKTATVKPPPPGKRPPKKK
jgi:hypothetical protein